MFIQHRIDGTKEHLAVLRLSQSEARALICELEYIMRESIDHETLYPTTITSQDNWGSVRIEVEQT